MDDSARAPHGADLEYRSASQPLHPERAARSRRPVGRGHGRRRDGRRPRQRPRVGLLGRHRRQRRHRHGLRSRSGSTRRTTPNGCPATEFGKRTLEVGDCGADVETLNWILKAKRYGNPTLAEDFDDSTEGAVRAFQADADLASDGVVRRSTSEAIVNSMPAQFATWYGPGLFGNKTACGQTLNRETLGVAHKTLPCGSKVVLRYKGRYVRTKVIDRGPVRKRRQVGPDPGDRRGARLRIHRRRRHPSRQARQARLTARRPLGRVRQDRGVRLVLRQRGRVGDQALELVHRHLGDRLEQLLVDPALLPRLLGEVLRGTAVGGDERLEEGEQRRLLRVARAEAAGAARSRRGRAPRRARCGRAGRPSRGRRDARRSRGRSARGSPGGGSRRAARGACARRTRSAAGAPARTPMNFETSPAAPWTPLRIFTLPSGAVSSSWMWNRLMSVFTVIGCPLGRPRATTYEAVNPPLLYF